MRVISVIGQKGGSGKSTVALHLAVCGESAGLSSAIIDTDPQGSAHKWFERREAQTPGVIREMDADTLPSLIKRAEGNGVDLLIIDTPGKAETMALAACELADLVLVPCRPTQFDLETLGTTKRTLRIAERLERSYVVLSQCPTTSKKVASEGEQAVKSYGLQLIPLRIHTRADFAYAMSSGLTATEFDSGGKAAEEARGLFAWASEQVGLSTREKVAA
jgi:chromosome partitioning protein